MRFGTDRAGARLKGKRIVVMNTDLKANYQGVYESRLGFGKRPAMLLVDFVQAYFDQPATCMRASRTRSPPPSGCVTLSARPGYRSSTPM